MTQIITRAQAILFIVLLICW